MSKLIAIAFMLSVATPLSAVAYTQEDIEACTPDAMRLCQQAFPDMRRVALCLVKNKRNLNPACTMASSAADLKFLHHPRQTRSGTSNRKAALES
jgi:hypothetical protein